MHVAMYKLPVVAEAMRFTLTSGVALYVASVNKLAWKAYMPGVGHVYLFVSRSNVDLESMSNASNGTAASTVRTLE